MFGVYTEIPNHDLTFKTRKSYVFPAKTDFEIAEFVGFLAISRLKEWKFYKRSRRSKFILTYQQLCAFSGAFERGLYYILVEWSKLGVFLPRTSLTSERVYPSLITLQTDILHSLLLTLHPSLFLCFTFDFKFTYTILTLQLQFGQRQYR